MAKLWQDLRDYLAGKYPAFNCANFIGVTPDLNTEHGWNLHFSELCEREKITAEAYAFTHAWHAGRQSALAANAQRARDEGWILCSEQLPPYDELVWLTLATNHARGKPVPAREQCWRVERGQRHATNKHGEIWGRAGIWGEMAWEVFSWTRSAQPAPDARAGK